MPTPRRPPPPPRRGTDLLGDPRRMPGAAECARDGRNVGFQRRVEALVVGGVVADQADDRRARTAGVVKVGPGIALTGSQMHQRGGGPPGDAAVAVGGPADDAFEQAQDRSQAGSRLRRLYQVQLGRSRVGEQGGYPRFDERAHQSICTIHGHRSFLVQLIPVSIRGRSADTARTCYLQTPPLAALVPPAGQKAEAAHPACRCSP